MRDREILMFSFADKPRDKLLFTDNDRNVVTDFLGFIGPLLYLFEIRDGSVHMFVDSANSSLAFNHNHTIYLNLRYFQENRKLSLNVSQLCVSPTY